MRLRLALTLLVCSSSSAWAGHCSWSLQTYWSEAKLSISNDKPTPNPRLMRVKGNSKHSTLVSVLSEVETQKALTELVAEPFAYHYPQEGCYARAHLMAKKLEHIGIISAKIFAWGAGKALQFVHPENEKTYYWGYHVAVLVLQRSESGDITPVIFDPAFSKEPLSMEKWLGKMAPQADDQPDYPVRLRVTERYRYYPPNFPDIDDPFLITPVKGWILQDTTDAWKTVKENEEIADGLSRSFAFNAIPNRIREFKHEFQIGFDDRSALYTLPKFMPLSETLIRTLLEARQTQKPVKVIFDPKKLVIFDVEQL